MSESFIYSCLGCGLVCAFFFLNGVGSPVLTGVGALVCFGMFAVEVSR